MSPPTAIAHADLHVHPSGEGGARRHPEAMYAALVRSGLAAAVLADHDRIDVARVLVARARDEGAPIALLVGQEITTREGHLVGIGLTSAVPVGLSYPDAIRAVHDQGGLAVAAHPTLPIPTCVSERRLLDLADGDPRARPDAIETMHPLADWWPGWRRRVERLAERAGYATVGGSDAHVPRSVGLVVTGFPGRDAADVVAAIRDRRTWVDGRRSPFRDLFRRPGTR